MAQRTFTFRIEGEEVPVQAFYQKVGAMLGVLRDVEHAAADEEADDAPPVKWVVESIRAESPVVMTLRADPPADEKVRDLVPRVIHLTTAGLKRIQSRTPLDEPPAGFTLSTLESVRELVRPSGGEVLGITVITPEETIPLSSQTSANVDRLLQARHQHFGNVEGLLETVSVAGRRPRIHLKNRLTGRAVTCIVPKERLPEVISVFGQRVSVYGRVRTNEVGEILNVILEEIEAFPTDDELPSVEQVAGAFDITGGKTVEEHLAELRDAS